MVEMVSVDADGRPKSFGHQPALSSMAREIQAAGLAPAVIEAALQVPTNTWILADVWTIGGEDLAEMPGAERALLCDQLADTVSGLTRSTHRAAKLGSRASSLADGRRFVVVA